ncbi:MAG: accessory gene regulator B family protein, partial [Desulfotomaculum sp.]|nr:accessory gene regulator B family protein [Desulfotomaculum sp.]
ISFICNYYHLHKTFYILDLLASHLIKNSKTEVPEDVISYGLEVILNLLVQLAVIIFIGYIFGFLPAVLAAVIPAIIYRSLSGGIHISSFVGCTAVSTLAFSLIGYISSKIILDTFTVTAVYICLIAAAVVWSPFSPKRNLTKKRLISFKVMSTLFLLVILAVCLLYLNNTHLSTAVVLGLTWQTLTITPPGIWIIKRLDILIHSRKGGKREHVQ